MCVMYLSKVEQWWWYNKGRGASFVLQQAPNTLAVGEPYRSTSSLPKASEYGKAVASSRKDYSSLLGKRGANCFS